jgi:hypothetical protein
MSSSAALGEVVMLLGVSGERETANRIDSVLAGFFDGAFTAELEPVAALGQMMIVGRALALVVCLELRAQTSGFDAHDRLCARIKTRRAVEYSYAQRILEPGGRCKLSTEKDRKRPAPGAANAALARILRFAPPARQKCPPAAGRYLSRSILLRLFDQCSVRPTGKEVQARAVVPYCRKTPPRFPPFSTCIAPVEGLPS